mgnify:CR=1 FL=1
MRYTVDRVSEGIAVLETETGERRTLELAKLPENVKEGDCLVEMNGTFSLDSKRTTRRKRKLHAWLKALGGSGDSAPQTKKK